jgi:hypothetical protein
MKDESRVEASPVNKSALSSVMIEGKRKQEQVTVEVEFIEANKNGFRVYQQEAKSKDPAVQEVDGGCDISIVF